LKPLVFSSGQFKIILAHSREIPRALRRRYLRKVARLLRGKEFNDRDVSIAAPAAVEQISEENRRG
jgi:hypothetical protein